MTLKQWNQEQIKIALGTFNRLQYFKATGNKFPSKQELVLFYIKHNAKTYSETHEND